MTRLKRGTSLLAAALIAASLATASPRTAEGGKKPRTDEAPSPAFEKDAEAARKRAVERAKELRLRGKGPFLRAAGMKAVIEGDLESGKAAFERLVAAEPDNDEGYLQLAATAEMSGDPAEAARLYTEAMRRRPDLAGYYLERRGRVLFQAERWDLALADAEKGLEAKPDDGDLLRLRAKSLINMGNFAEAAASYQKSMAGGRRVKTGEDAWICSSLKGRGQNPEACRS